jgi:hypothetical protein
MLPGVTVPVHVDPNDHQYVALSFDQLSRAIRLRGSGRSHTGAGLDEFASEAA